MTQHDHLAQMQVSLQTLERRVRRNRMMTITFAALALTAAPTDGIPTPGFAAAADNATSRNDSVLILRELVIVDSMGTPRVRIAAPLPDPIMLGKRFNRGGAVSGIIIYDGEGNERGGYVTGDESRGAALTLDEMMRAAVHIGVEDRGEAHISVDNGLGGYGLLGINQRDGAFIRLHGGGKMTAIPDTAR
jgi:hypothetical protein